MDRLHQRNPFAKRDSHSANSIITYKVLTLLTWLLSVITTVYYTFDYPRDALHIHHRIWDWNTLYPTGFSLNSLIVSLYWLVLFLLQLGYVGHLFSSNVETVNAACSVGSHFIVNNLFHFAFIMLFVRSFFGWAELFLVLNFFNLSSLYFRHPGYSAFIHVPAVTGPLAWTFVAIYWNGAISVHHPDSLVARIFANIFVWSILVYAGFFLLTYKDYTMGFALSVLTAALGVAQFQRQVVALQWIFAFTIMAVVFVLTVVIGGPKLLGKETRQAPADQERAPLLAGES